MTPELSIVVPCHNEEGNLPPLVEAIDQVLAPLKVSYEIIITDESEGVEVLADGCGKGHGGKDAHLEIRYTENTVSCSLCTVSILT